MSKSKEINEKIISVVNDYYWNYHDEKNRDKILISRIRSIFKREQKNHERKSNKLDSNTGSSSV